MTTEVQIRKSRNYLPHLRKVVACLAAGLGMSRNEAQDTEEAVSEICTSSIEAAPDDIDCSLSIKLHAHENCMTVEISDPACAFTAPGSGHWRLAGVASAVTYQKVRRLADAVEFMPAAEGTTIRFTKYAREIALSAMPSLDHLPTSTLHA